MKYKEKHKVGTRRVATTLNEDLAGRANKEAKESLEDFLIWPPDLFALTSRILSLSGAYTNVVSPPIQKKWPPIFLDTKKKHPSQKGKKIIDKAWHERVREIGMAWRKGLELVPGLFPSPTPGKSSYDEYFEDFEKEQNRIIAAAGPALSATRPASQFYLCQNQILPIEVKDTWDQFMLTISPERDGTILDFQFYDWDEEHNHCTRPNGGMCDHCNLWDSFEALMTLHAIADEVCSGWGIRGPKTLKTGKDPATGSSAKGKAQEYAEDLLNMHGTLATINTARGRVLPKRHTPGVGITLRSLSYNLAFHQSSVDLSWKTNSEINNRLTKKFSIGNGEEEAKLENQKPTHDDDSFAVLLFPWPFKIPSTDFQPVQLPDVEMDRDQYSFFSYNPQKERRECL